MSSMTNTKFKTIVVATGLSEPGSYALAYAQAIAGRQSSSIVIVPVVDTVSYAFPSREPEEMKANQLAGEEVKRIEANTLRKAIPVHSIVEAGIIRERILQSAQDHHADLLVLGTHAKTQAGRVAFGIVIRQMIAKATCPILAVASGTHLGFRGEWKRVLVATDFSAASLTALEFAQGVTYGELLVLHAACCANKNRNSNNLERLRYFAPFNESHTVPVNHVVVPGDPASVIIDYARDFLPDLIVLGSPGNDLPPEELAASTVVQAISQASCPVLCVPSKAAKSAEKVISEVAAA